MEVDFVIIGAGVIGLAVAEALSRKYPASTTVVIERHAKLGQEISSHHSEVIHAGLYYPIGSLKAKHCFAGNRLLYEFCKSYDVPYRRCGKYVVATEKNQLQTLHDIHRLTTLNNVQGVRFLSQAEIKKSFPNDPVVEGLWSADTGIIDSHVFMQRLEALSLDRGVIFLYNHGFQGVHDEFKFDGSVLVQEPSGKVFQLKAKWLLNAGGLNAVTIAKNFGLARDLEIRPCRGRYFKLSNKWTKRYESLIYPIPDPAGGLGVHLTLNLEGQCRLGPDVDWDGGSNLPADSPAQYSFTSEDERQRLKFYESGKRFLSGLQLDDLSPDYIGVRPKLFKEGISQNDFHLIKSKDSGNQVHFLGIESPGLTSSLSLAQYLCEEIAVS